MNLSGALWEKQGGWKMQRQAVPRKQAQITVLWMPARRAGRAACAGSEVVFRGRDFLF